jgi:hypothetical protein
MAAPDKMVNKPGNAPIKKVGQTSSSKFGTNTTAQPKGRPTPRDESIR